MAARNVSLSKVFDLCKQHNVNVDHLPEQKLIIEGSFEDITHFHQAIKKAHDDPSVQAPFHVQRGSDVYEVAGKEAPKPDVEITEDQGEIQLIFASRDYGWLNQVWLDTALGIQQDHEVDVDPEIHLHIKMTTQDDSHHAEKLRALKESIQSLIKSLKNDSMSGINRPIAQQASSKTETESPFTTEALEEVDVTIRSTESSRFLEHDLKKAFKDKLMMKTNMIVKPETSATSVTLKIRKVHWRLMDNALKNELKGLNCELLVFINYFTGNVWTLLKHRVSHQDLPREALNIFSDLYEQAIKSCTTRPALISSRKLVIETYKKRKGIHPGVQLSIDQGDGISLLGLPQDVDEAVKDIEDTLGQKVFQGKGGESTVYSFSRTENTGEKCYICMELYVNRMVAPCNHSFCMECWEKSTDLKPECPICKRTCEEMERSNPNGSMTHESQQATSKKDSSEDSTETRDQNKEEVENTCHICMNVIVNKMTAPCKHSFCTECWEMAIVLRPECPTCRRHLKIAEGIQPKGFMKYTVDPLCHLPLSVYPCGTIVIKYFIPNGVQLVEHPEPGQPYRGVFKRAYLPDNPEGREVLRLLQKAFEEKLMFTIQKSEQMGAQYVTCSDIDHKTSIYGGPAEFAYPDQDYLKRVTDQLHAKGIY